MLEVVGLAAGYLGERVIDGIDVEVRTGEAVAIVGSNGAGKTTLFRAIAGLLPAMEGRVILDGKDLTRSPAHRISRAGIAYVPAERHLFPAMTLKTNLVLGAYPNRPDRETLELVYDLFPRLKERQRQHAGTLSGGEQQMLAVARALTARPRLLMLDEPTTGLAPKVAQIAFEAFEGLKNAGMTLLIAEQQVPLALWIADRGYVLENGRIRSRDLRRSSSGTRRRDARTWGSLESGHPRRARRRAGVRPARRRYDAGLRSPASQLRLRPDLALALIVISVVMEDGVPTVGASWACWRRAASPSCWTHVTRLVYRQHGEERTLLVVFRRTPRPSFVIGGLLAWKYPAGALYIPFVVGSIGHRRSDVVGAYGRRRSRSSWPQRPWRSSATIFGVESSAIQDETGARLVHRVLNRQRPGAERRARRAWSQ